ncbi:MAG: hypothetical protein Q4A75_06150, partial [Peptostreptococcaceae bacterium]|nr:hypothetical protein [Peptostreptococcaceae bacterium]
GLGVAYDPQSKTVSIDTATVSTQPDQSQDPKQPEQPKQPQDPQSQVSQPGKIQKVVVDGTEVPFEIKDGKTYVPFGALKNSLKIEKISVEPLGNAKMLYFKNGGLDIGFYPYDIHGFWQDDAPVDDESIRLYKSGDNWMIPLQKIVKAFKLDYETNDGIFSVDSSNPGYVIISGAVDAWNDDSISEFYEWLRQGTVRGVKYKGWDKDQGGPIQPY